MSSLPTSTEDSRAPLLGRSHSPIPHPHSPANLNPNSISITMDMSRPLSRSGSLTDMKQDDGHGLGMTTSHSASDMKQEIQQDADVPYYQRNYDRIVQKLKAQRELEIKQNREKKILFTPNQQFRILGIGCLVVCTIIVILVFIFYPRLPTWNINEMRILEYEPDEIHMSARFHIALSTSIINNNFVTMGVEYMHINFWHNQTLLGQQIIGQTRFSSRSTSDLTLDGQFGSLGPLIFPGIYQELQQTDGVISLIMEADVRTNEIFRLNDLKVTCSFQAKFDYTHSQTSIIAPITAWTCQHNVMARSNHQRDLI